MTAQTTSKAKTKAANATIDLITMADACVTLRYSRKTIYRMVAKGELPKPVKFGNHRQCYFDRAAFVQACNVALA